MLTFDAKRRPPPWFFQFIESYSHLFLNLKFNKKDDFEELVEFNIKLELRGFEGLLFYIYRSSYNKMEFDVINQQVDSIHIIEGLHVNLGGLRPMESIDFIIIPFGHFKMDNRFLPSIECTKYESSFQVFTWIPSLLFKKVKSIIRIDNKYNELIPLDDVSSSGYYFNFNFAFKGNKTEMLFSLINTLSDIDANMEYESMASGIKDLITKTNEYLFELSEKKVPLEMQNLLKELERLKFNIDNLSKEEIFNWLDDILDYYSR
ncbi:MAG: hypothetical protein ACTSV5_15100 [Promethearchaeota archaeon]